MDTISYSFRFQDYISSWQETRKADALSQCLYLAPRPGDPVFDNKKQVILGPTGHKQLQALILHYIRALLILFVMISRHVPFCNTIYIILSCSQSQHLGTDYKQFK